MFDLRERGASTVFRCTICNTPVCADVNPENYAAQETREQIARRNCTACFRNIRGRKH